MEEGCVYELANQFMEKTYGRIDFNDTDIMLYIETFGARAFEPLQELSI